MTEILSNDTTAGVFILASGEGGGNIEIHDIAFEGISANNAGSIGISIATALESQQVLIEGVSVSDFETGIQLKNRDFSSFIRVYSDCNKTDWDIQTGASLNTFENSYADYCGPACSGADGCSTGFDFSDGGNVVVDGDFASNTNDWIFESGVKGQEFKFTLKQTAGTGRNYDWKVVTI